MSGNSAYNFVAMMLMLAEAGFFCSVMELPGGGAFTERDVRRGSHVGPPALGHFSGSILTDDYFFGFWQGHLANFHKRGFMPQDSDQAIRNRNLELAKFSSLIDANAAYQLATNRLAAFGIDLHALEGKYRRNIIQWKFYPEGKEGPVIMLPVYHVEWLGFILRTQTNRERAVVSVDIYGATREVVEFHVLDDSLFLHPSIQIKSLEKLMAISDAEFAGYDALQKSNLIVKSAVYPNTGLLLPKAIRAPQTTNTVNKSPQNEGDPQLGPPQRLKNTNGERQIKRVPSKSSD